MLSPSSVLAEFLLLDACRLWASGLGYGGGGVPGGVAIRSQPSVDSERSFNDSEATNLREESPGDTILIGSGLDFVL